MSTSRQSQKSPKRERFLTEETFIDLPAERRNALVEILNARLADLFDLHSQTKQAHWNVKGPSFYSLHLLFDDLAETVENDVDLVAERVRALGGTAKGTARLAAANSELEEFPETLGEDLDFARALAERYAEEAKLVREAIDEADDLGDQATADIFTSIVRDLDKALYLLEAHFQKIRTAGVGNGRR